MHRFPRALPRAVEDYDAWVSGVPRILDLLKQAIHQHQSLPEHHLETESRFPSAIANQGLALAKSDPDLQPVINAFSWLCFLNPKQLKAAINWVDCSRPTLRNVLSARPGIDGIVAVFSLWEVLRRDNKRRVVPLINTFGDPRTFDVSTSGAEEYLQELQTQVANLFKQNRPAEVIPERPSATFGNVLLELAAWLNTQSRRTRRRALQLAPLVFVVDTLTPWQQWWSELDGFEKKFRRLRGKPWTPEAREAAGRLNDTLQVIKARVVKVPSHDDVLAHLQQLAISRDSGICDSISRILSNVPVLDRSRFLVQWAVASQGYNSHQVTAFLRALAETLTADNVGMLAPWNGGRRRDSMWEILRTDRRHYSRILQCVDRCHAASDDSLTSDDVRQIVAFTVATEDHRIAGEYYWQLRRADRRDEWFSAEDCQLAHQLQTASERFVDLLVAIDGLESDRSDAIAALATRFAQSGWYDVCEEWLLSGMGAQLANLAARWTALKSLETESAPPEYPRNPQRPGWAIRFPPELETVLAILAAVTPDAERTAARILRKNFPDPAALQQERDALRSRLEHESPHEHLGSRLTQLEQWLSHPPAVSPPRLRTLKRKLWRVVQRVVVRQLSRKVDEAGRRIAKVVLHSSVLPDWIQQPENMRLLAAILELRPAFRDLGLRLLRSRCGTESWDLLQEPKNRAFLTRLRDRGIDPAPGLSNARPREIEIDGGVRIVVGLEDDPIEILHMGRHFQTCLSPGSFNFFSAVSNAVDINKRVFYGRDATGRVDGRCLMAISNQGGILAFHPYAHDNRRSFGRIVAQTAEDLAEQMGTVVVPRGEVECLVASDWYDDGPVDICGRFAFLEFQSEFRASLKTIDATEFAAVLENQFDPLPLNSMTLPWVIQMTELDDRPDLILPLLPVIEDAADLSHDCRVRAATLAHRAGAFRFSHRVLRAFALRELSKRRDWYHVSIDVLNAVAEIDPTVGLRLLRRTRRDHVAADEDETDSQRRCLLATVHEQLGRSALAARLRMAPG